MSRWFREPLLHFVAAGGLLFAAYAWINCEVNDELRVVRITAAEVDWLKKTWARQWQRSPSEQELRRLVTDYLKELLLAREAREIGLEEDDTIVRRRLAQKMQFLVQDTVRLAEPGEDELRRFFTAHQADYLTAARISFLQVYYKTQEAARAGLGELATRDPLELGDQTLLEREFAGADAQAVTSLFGPDFSAKLFNLETGRWHGPVASTYGWHLVQIRGRNEAQKGSFEDVREQVLEAWYRAQQARASEQFFAGLLKKYDVVVDESVQPLIGPLAEVTP